MTGHILLDQEREKTKALQAQVEALTADSYLQAGLLGASIRREEKLQERVEALEKGIMEFVAKGHTDECLYFVGNCDCGHDELAALLQEQTK